MDPLFITNNLTQAFEDFTSQLLFSTLENLILFIFLTTAIFLIISTPLALLINGIESYLKQLKFKGIIDKSICCENKLTHKSYDNKICTIYIRHFSNVMSSFFALSVWVVTSLVYISLYFDSIYTGIISYFKFPFDVLSSYNFNESILSLKNYESSWYFMLGIFVVTVSTYVIAKQVSPYLIKKTITEKTDAYSFA